MTPYTALRATCLVLAGLSLAPAFPASATNPSCDPHSDPVVAQVQGAACSAACDPLPHPTAAAAQTYVCGIWLPIPQHYCTPSRNIPTTSTPLPKYCVTLIEGP